MNGLYLRGKTWWLRFTPTAGAKQERYSTGHSDEAEAIVIARQLLERRKTHGLIVTDTCDAEISAFLADGKRKGLAKSTLATRGYVLRSFAREMGVARPSLISTIAIERWFVALQAQHLRTAADYLAHVQLWFKWLHRVGKISVNTAALVRMPKLPMRGRRTFLLPDQARLLISECEDPGLKFALYCGLHAGMRKMEVIEARPDWFDLTAGLLHIQSTPTFSPKTRDNRTVPLTKEFRAWLADDYGLQSPFMLAPSRTHGRHRYRYDFLSRYQTLLRKVNLFVTFHDLRRTFASLHVSRGTSIYKVAKWLGDTVTVVESTYGHLIPQDAEINAAWD